MRHYFLRFFILSLMLLASGLAQGSEVVGRFTGSGNGETAEFEVESPWLLDWVVNGDYPQMLAIEVSLLDAKTGTHEGYVLKTKYKGNGVRLFNQAGRYRLRVDATMANWILKVEQLTREEAALYTPKEKTDL